MRSALMILTALAISSGSPTIFAGPTPVYAYIFNARSKDVTVIDTATNAVIKTVPWGASVGWLSTEQRPSDGRIIWTYEVTGGRVEHGEPVAGTVTVLALDPRSWTIARRIPVGRGSAFGLVLTPDQKFVLVIAAEEGICHLLRIG